MDAQGVKRVEGRGCVCLITIIDVVTRLKVESYPSLARVQPTLAEYQLALRRAFLQYGLPQQISLDHGTVFYDNSNPSPYSTRLHLWLLALGVAGNASITAFQVGAGLWCASSIRTRSKRSSGGAGMPFWAGLTLRGVATTTS